MLFIPNRDLTENAAETLAQLQAEVDRAADYSGRVAAAGEAWAKKMSGKRSRDAFLEVREVLATMCVGAVRCAYCEDSQADEIEHIYPKNIFPGRTFAWANYAFACGPCNGPKSNRYGYVEEQVVREMPRARAGAEKEPPAAPAGLIDPRSEDPTDFLELDLGGTTPDGMELHATFEFQPRDDIDPAASARAVFTINVLRLNREVLRAARENAFGGFRARLREYVQALTQGASDQQLERYRTGLLETPHLTVFFEMRRQREVLPKINALLAAAPEAARWPLVVPE